MSTSSIPSSSNESPWMEKNLSYILGVILLIAAVAIVVVVSLYANNFSRYFSTQNDAWGQFGDYIGGTLNPLLSFLALIALLLTLWIQARSLDTARRQMTQQSEVASLSAQISAITALLSSLNDQITQDNIYTSNGGTNHLKGNRVRLDRREELLLRLDSLYEKLANTPSAS